LKAEVTSDNAWLPEGVLDSLDSRLWKCGIRVEEQQRITASQRGTGI